MPSAPAKAASTTPAFGLGWRAASRRHARITANGEPPTAGAQRTTRAPVRRGKMVGDIVQSCRGPTEPDIARRPVADHRVQRIDRTIGQHAGTPRPKPKTTAPHAHPTCSRRPTPNLHAPAHPHRAPKDPDRTRRATTLGHRRPGHRRANRPGAHPRRPGLAPSDTHVAAPPRAPSSHGSAASRPPASQCAGLLRCGCRGR